MRSRTVLWGVVALAGCTDDPATDSGGVSRLALIDPSLWSPVAAEDDPASDRPDAVDCPSSSWSVEQASSGETVLELDTGLCDYAAFSQPSLVAAAAGDTVGLSWSHSALVADVPAQAHVALWLGEAVLWDSVEPIPADPAETRYELILDADAPAGTRVWAHLHNHGDNTWNLGEIWTEAAEPPQ